MNRDEVYLRILTLGLLALRDRAPQFKSPKLVQAESDHLHNIPSLIGEENIQRHIFYYNSERTLYVERLKKLNLPEYSEHQLSSYVGLWNQLLEHLPLAPPASKTSQS